jgi:hypothetical protein
MAVELSSITEELTDVAEMSDGTVWVARASGATPLLRLATSARTQVCRLNGCDLALISGTVDEIAGPETVDGVLALHPAGWALAAGEAGLQVWQYADGVWGVIAIGEASSAGELTLQAIEIEPYVVRNLYQLSLVYARRGSALVAVPWDSVPVKLREMYEASFVNSFLQSSGAPSLLPQRTIAAWWRDAWYGAAGVFGRWDGHAMTSLGALEAAPVRAVATARAFHLFGQEGSSPGQEGNWACLRDGLFATRRDAPYVPLAGHETAGRLWLVGHDRGIIGGGYPDPNYVLLQVTVGPGGVWVYAREVDGVVGLQVENAPDPGANGWYHPDGTHNGETAYVNEDGTWWIIWDGTNWILAPYGTEGGGFTTVLDGTTQGLVVWGSDDPSCDGEYEADGTVNGRMSWDQVDGEHHIIWDGTQWVLTDGEGTVIYTDGSGSAPWLGLWDGCIVAGRMTPSDEYLEPAGAEVRWLYEPELAADTPTEKAHEVRLVVKAPAADVAQMRALVRVDPETTESRDWRDYQVLPIGAAGCVLETPGYQVEVALLKPAAVAWPEGTVLATGRYEE